MFKKGIKNICCIGAGYVGGPTMSVIAENCPDIKVNVVDINDERIKKWNSNELNQLPIYEPGLAEIIKKCRDQNLFFSTDVEVCISKADVIFISVNTPTKTKGIGAGYASDLSWIESSAKKIAEFANDHTIVVEKSTLPVKTAETIKKILNEKNLKNKNKKSFSIISNPEFLAEGTAINDLRYPDRVLIGGEDPESIELIANIFQNWVPSNKIIKTNIWSSELSKLVANAFLAQRISSINSISALCESTGADIKEVSTAVGADHRIGNEFLNSGPGFGGSCFKKDILNLVYLCRHYGLVEVAEYWEQVMKINIWQQKRIYSIIVEKLFGNINDKKITILGFSFKANTNDIRESPSIEISKNLLIEGAKISIYDPKVSRDQILKVLNPLYENLNKNCVVESSILKASYEADAILILTDWEEFRKIDWEEIFHVVKKPVWIFDTRNVCNDVSNLKKIGFNIWKLGCAN